MRRVQLHTGNLSKNTQLQVRLLLKKVGERVSIPSKIVGAPFPPYYISGTQRLDDT